MKNTSKFFVLSSILTLHAIGGYPVAWRVPIPIRAKPKPNHALYPTQTNTAAITGAGIIASQRNQSTGSSGNDWIIVLIILAPILHLVGLFLLFWICVGLYLGFSICYDYAVCIICCCGLCRKK